MHALSLVKASFAKNAKQPKAAKSSPKIMQKCNVKIAKQPKAVKRLFANPTGSCSIYKPHTKHPKAALAAQSSPK